MREGNTLDASSRVFSLSLVFLLFNWLSDSCRLMFFFPFLLFDCGTFAECSDHQNLENTSEKEKAVPTCKIIASHCFALLMIVMFKFTYGLNSGFTTIIIPELYKADAEIKISINELTWFSSYCFTPPVGAILGGFLTQFIGCRMMLVICGISYITSGLIFYFSTNAVMLLSAQVIVGFVDGMQKGPSFTFLAEISLPQYRSVIMTCIGLGMMFGIFTATILGTYIYWRTLALINVIYPSVGLLLTCFIPESPYWLASKNRYEDAKRSLAWFRGWTLPDSVEGEMRSVFSSSESMSPSKNTQKNSITSPQGKWHLRQMAKPYLNRSFYIPFLTIVFVFVINNFNGIWTLNVFSVLVFEEINSPVDSHIGAIIFSAFRVLGSITCMLLINLVGKRKLLFITLPICAVVLATAATFGFLTSTDQLTSEIYRWIPSICIFAAVFFTTVGIDKISILLNSEIFPLHLRHVGVGAGQFVNTIFLSVMNKVFLYLVGAVTMSGTFIFFAVVNIVGLVGMYFVVPETEGKTLQEIEEHYAGIKSLSKTKIKA